MDDRLVDLLVVVAWVLIWVYGQVAKRRRAARQATAPDGAAGPLARELGGHRGVFSGGGRRHLLEHLRQGTGQTRAAAAGLGAETAGDPRMTRVHPAVAEELLPALDRLATALEGEPSEPELQRLAYALAHEQRLLAYLQQMVAQRRTMDLRYLGDADAVAEACFRPVIDFTTAEGLPHATLVPVTVHGRWDLSIDLAFRHSRIAPVRLPDAFGASLWAWPALAHEVAHDLYFSVAGFEDEIHQRLRLPRGGFVPNALMSVDDCHLLYGAWMAELVADLVGVLMMGPAYLESMQVLFARPQNPIEARVGYLGPQNVLGPHPPSRLRLRLGCSVLDYLGRHAEAASLRERWEALHDGVPTYILPTAMGWVEVPEERVEVAGQAILDVFLTEGWRSLNGFWLMDIPGFSYLPAEHAEVLRARAALVEGRVVRGDPRLIVAAGVLATVEAPARHDRILEATRRSIVGIGTGERTYRRPPAVPGAAPSRASLVEALRDPNAILEALVVGEALGRRRRT